MKNKNNKKSKKSARNPKSQKGLRGNIVGAPPKPVKFPATPFTVATFVGRNQSVCELTLRNRLVKELINTKDGTNASGTVYRLADRPQKGGAVGRPKAIFVTKENYDGAKMTLYVYGPKTSTAPKTPKVKVTKVTPAVSVPVTQPPFASITPATSTPALVAQVEAPASPAPETPALVVETVPVVEVVATAPAAEPVAETVTSTETAPVAVSETPSTPVIG